MATKKSTKSQPRKADSSPSKPVKSSAKTEQAITVNIEPFLTPISIILTGIMISASILISFKDATFSGSTNNNNGGTTVTEPTDEGFAAASTNIDDDAVYGDRDNAKIAIVEFTDFECPYCQRHHTDTYGQLISEYVDSGDAIYVIRDFPLSFHDPKATEAAIAAECARDVSGNDSKYFEFVDEYFAKTATNGAGLSGTTIGELAASIGVNKGQVENCVEDEKFAEEVAKDLQDGQAAGVTGTPGFVIGLLDKDGNVEGISVPGAQPFATFQQVIDEQLAR